MLQYRDGSFSEQMPLDEAWARWAEALKKGSARSLHVGTPSELDQIVEDANYARRLDELEKRLAKIEEGPLQSDTLYLPTRDEIISVLRSETLGGTHE